MRDDHIYEAQDLEALSGIPNYQEWILDIFSPYLRGETVEIGAGIGTFTQRLLAHVDRLEAVEPSPNLIAALRREFDATAAIDLVPKTAEDYLSGATPESRDTIVLVNVLEHIKDDAALLSSLFRLLRPGGSLLMFVPALSWLFSALDETVGHHRRYHKRALTDLVANVGFDVVSSRYFDILGVLPWWLIHTLGRETRFDQRRAKMYDRFFVPIGRTLESMFPPPFGKNIVLVARKPGAAS